jgi:transposase-like protein
MADAIDITRWQQCPVCHRGATIEGHGVEIENLRAIQRCYCTHCDATWTEVYEASHRENIERGEV